MKTIVLTSVFIFVSLQGAYAVDPIINGSFDTSTDWQWFQADAGLAAYGQGAARVRVGSVANGYGFICQELTGLTVGENISVSFYAETVSGFPSVGLYRLNRNEIATTLCPVSPGFVSVNHTVTSNDISQGLYVGMLAEGVAYEEALSTKYLVQATRRLRRRKHRRQLQLRLYRRRRPTSWRRAMRTTPSLVSMGTLAITSAHSFPVEQAVAACSPRLMT